MLIAASFAQVSATHESRAAPPSRTLPFLFQMVLPVQIGCWGRGEGTAPGARPTSVRVHLWQNCHCRLRRRGPRGQVASAYNRRKGRPETRRSGTTFRQFGKPGLFIDALLVLLR